MLALSDPSAPLIWDFALAFYAWAGVEADCLAAQDHHGLDVTALIFALYRSRNGLGFDAGATAELARSLSARVVEPLRAARVALKPLVDGAASARATALRRSVKAAELEAERLVLDSLDALPTNAPTLSCFDALCAIADASQAKMDEALLSLLKRLAISAQNM
jgi:uncharacterized protein (TIGR02444 family)